MAAIDLTELWNSAHAHLTVDPDALPLRASDRHPCPLCGGARAFDLLADLRCGTDGPWIARQAVRWCPDCKRHSIDEAAWSAACRQAGVASPMPPQAINARLWSANPTFLNIEPTTRCNFSCWYCVGRHLAQQDIREEDFATLLDHFPSVRAIALVGEGEPLMHTGFFRMARMAADRGIKVLTISNGSTFSTANVRKLCEAGVSYVSISIDSTDPAEFASSRIGGDLQKVLEGIRRLADFRDANGYRYPRIGVKGTLFSYSEGQLPAVVELAKSYGVDVFESFQPLNPMRTYVPIYPKDKLPELETVDRVAGRIARDSAAAGSQLQPVLEFCQQEGIRPDKNGTPNGIRPNCDEEWIYTLLSGDITPCCQIKTPPSPHWNLFQRPLIDILRDADYERTRFNLWNGLFPQYCAGCWKTR